MHVTPVAPDTDHMDAMSVATREITSRLQTRLKPGCTIASIIDWKTQEHSLHFYRYNSEGRLQRAFAIELKNVTDIEAAYQDALIQAIEHKYATSA